MSVLKFKPNSLQYKIVEPGYTDEKGDFHKGESHWSDDIECDAVPNGKADTNESTDGDTNSYSFVVYLPVSVKDFQFGEIVRLNRYGVIYELQVKGFHRYQKQVKIWV